MSIYPTSVKKISILNTVEKQRSFAFLLTVCFAFSLPISNAATVFFESFLILMWLVAGNWKIKFIDLVRNPINLPITLFLFYTLISVLWANNINYALEYIGKYRHFLVIPAIIYFITPIHVRMILIAFIAGNIVAALISYSATNEWFLIGRATPHNPSPFRNYIDFNILLALTTSILLTIAIYTRDKFNKFLLVILAVFTAIIIFNNLGRTGQIALLVSLSSIFFIQYRRKVLLLALTSILVIGSTFLAYKKIPQFNNRIEQGQQDISRIFQSDFTGSIGSRIALWFIGAKLATTHPLFGYGIGDERVAQKTYLETTSDFSHDTRKHLMRFSDNHNAFLTLLLQGGLVGLGLILWLLYRIYQLPTTPNSEFHLIKYQFLIIFLIWSLGGNSFHLLASLTVFSLFTGLLAVVAQETETFAIPGKKNNNSSQSSSA